MKRLIPLFTVLVLFLFACGSNKDVVEASSSLEGIGGSSDQEFMELVNRMTGSFSSAQQAENDSDFYSIDLHMTPFKYENGVQYFYVEQSLSSTPESPYRQRVYQVKREDAETIGSAIYLINNEKDFIGAHLKPEMLDAMSMDSIAIKEGCAVYLKKKEDEFQGSTVEGDCLSDFRGASYTTSEVSIHLNKVVSWDRGWDKEGNQVWGATKSGYIFKKM
ncbi:MAG: chromophore lyase CpcT/CpeT [Bacteroidota bacterium]